MQKRKNDLSSNTSRNLILIIGLVVALALFTPIVEMLVGLVIGSIALVIGLSIGAVALAFGLVAAIFSLMLAFAPIVVPIAVIYFVVKAINSDTPPQRKRKNDFI